VRSLFVMDPIETLNWSGDSTYAVMLEATRRGQPIAWCTPSDLSILSGVAYAKLHPVTALAEAPHYEQEEAQLEPLSAFDVIWMRKDPPFDMHYVFATYILDLAPGLVVNHPLGLKAFNEKIWAMHFAQFQPPTLLSNDADQVREFVAAQPNGAVLKPWDGNGGRGVFITKAGDRNLPSMIETLTENGRHHIIAQGYLSEVAEGDKRILIFDGEPVGAMLRVPGADDHRANMHVGATVAPCELSERDKEICDALKPLLKEHDQIFVGIDIIGGMLTEINVTSPTGIWEINALYGLDLAADLLDCVQARLES